MTNEFVAFASRFNVSVADAYVLPALFERTAQMVNRTARGLLADATYSNQALGEYLADAARKVADADRKERAN